jgi:hypothetical protein
LGSVRLGHFRPHFLEFIMADKSAAPAAPVNNRAPVFIALALKAAAGDKAAALSAAAAAVARGVALTIKDGNITPLKEAAAALAALKGKKAAPRAAALNSAMVAAAPAIGYAPAAATVWDERKGAARRGSAEEAASKEAAPAMG